MEDSFNTETCIETLKLLSGDRALKEMIHAGRERWKIENEGFNNQKNRIYGIRHLNSRNRTATKNHYLLTQVADIIMQLYLAWNLAVKETGQSILQGYRKASDGRQ